MANRKLAPCAALAVVVFILLFSSTRTARETWQGLPQHIDLSLLRDDSGGDLATGNQQHKDPHYVIWNPKPNFKPGSPMPTDHNWTSTLVIAKVKDENTDWIDRELPDQTNVIYIADDPSAPLHAPKNKGHEVMIYLSWIIDNYDSLPDVVLFMHAHQIAWHNDDVLGFDAVQLIQRLSRPRVWREGYVNLRCSWFPGCPDWMHPGETEENEGKQEEVFLAKSWSELFPLDEVPQVLAQPCCAQFAVSRERIQAKPHAQYIWYRDWLFSTTLPDHLSGRVWEYIWQVVFTGENVHCPKEHVCYCDQYGSCFGSEHEYDVFKRVKDELGGRERDLREWEGKREAIKKALEDGRLEEAEAMEKPEAGLDEECRKEIQRLRPVVDKLEGDAVERGKDAMHRAMEAEREWHDKDGF